LQSPPDTVPEALTPQLKAFCRTISDSDPVFISSVPFQSSSSSFCFDNVAAKVRRNGGSIAYGWAIWNLQSFYFEAEHHAVWRNKLGNLIDVTPQMGKRRRMLFLPDDGAIYDSNQPRQNILFPDGNSAAAVEMTDLGNRRHSLLTRCRMPGTPKIQLFERDQIELAQIDIQIQALMVR
jgi:hypothetical protein